MNSDRIAIVNALAIQKAGYAADDQDIALQVRYIGSEASGKVEVNAGGDLVFTHGDLASEAADTTVSTDGTIDVSGASENTFGEVVDAINASANWEARLIGALRADSSNDTLLAMASTQANTAAGIALYWDTSVALTLTQAVSGKFWEAQKTTDGAVFDVNEDNYINSVCEIYYNNTYGSGTSLIQIYEVDRATSRETIIYQETGAATTVTGTIDLTDIGNAWGLCAAKGCDLVVRLIGSAACTGFFRVIGTSRKFGY